MRKNLILAASISAVSLCSLIAQTASPAAGRVEHIKVHGRALEGNLEGDSPDRDVTVCLPPSYATDQNRRYPVIYILHGYGGNDSTWTGRIANVPEIADRVFESGSAKEMIVVAPSAQTVYTGSMYSNSPVTGDWEVFIARDLVEYVDTHYRTLADRMSRGLAGHSMGGYGTVRIGMKHPEVFSSLYALSSCCLTANLNPGQNAAAAEAIKTPEQARAAGRGAMTTLAESAAWSPNPKNPPLFFDLPTKDGKPQPAVVAKWAANAPLAMLDQYVPNLTQFHAIAADVGLQDTLLESNKMLDAELSRLDVVHTFELYEGDHTNHVKDRIEQKVLPFFSHNLSFSKGTK
jgi:enterochelin esterase-like enzyme